MDEVGQRLRAARIEKGLTIDDLQQSTKIQKRYLIAIEEGQLDLLPGEFYERAFMKQYAQAVGLDSKELLGDTIAEVPEDSEKNTVKANNPVKESIVKEENQSGQGKELVKRYLPQAIVIILVVIILGVIFGIATNNKAKNQTVIPDKSETVKQEAAKKKAAKKKAEEEKQAEAKKAAEAEANKFKVTEDPNNPNNITVENLPESNNKLILKGGSSAAWTSVKTDGTTAWMGSLEAGATQEIALPDDVKTFIVHSGNTPAISMKINDTDVTISNLTTGGSVRTFTFTIKK
ncbi:XRE family transcriptional regulator [Companilactobacillus sp. RD055328]|uniref:helix-turn-helix domain-containing protein n=1 Tax=Companilactobacillus sp. RD055328 TaxID=2916634 RepID=UPI001FC8184C|nr:RodZ domain-containing protein [Companilactobacillus sp. RD055328]GKQ43069.1 XRE family transcriptional regulator [Companilactobacillus sp. RD055328]